MFNLEMLFHDPSPNTQEDSDMEGRKITNEERGCISNCIFQHWGDPDSKESPESRDKKYENCLEDCRICG